jgi:hypothetical protein
MLYKFDRYPITPKTLPIGPKIDNIKVKIYELEGKELKVKLSF